MGDIPKPRPYPYLKQNKKLRKRHKEVLRDSYFDIEGFIKELKEKHCTKR